MEKAIFTGAEYEARAIKSFKQGRTEAYNEILEFIRNNSENHNLKHDLYTKIDELIKKNEGAK